MSDEYVPVWQTWTLVSTSSVARAAVEGEHDAAFNVGRASCAPLAARATPAEEFRHRLQAARIDRRMSIAELALNVKCDAETLAAFERGTEAMDADMQRRLRNVLNLR